MLLQLILWILLFSPKSIFLYTFIISFLYGLIIKLKPFASLLLDKGIIMATLRSTGMYNNTSQLVLIEIVRNIAHDLVFISVELAHVLLHIYLLWEFQLIVDLYFAHLVKIECKTFQYDYQDVGELFYAQPLHCTHFLLA